MILSRQLASVCGRVVGFELRACVQTTDHHCSAAGSESSRRTAPHGPACRPAAPSLCLYFVILSSSYYRISSVISCVCAPPSIRILLPSVAHQVLYPWICCCVVLYREIGTPEPCLGRPTTKSDYQMLPLIRQLTAAWNVEPTFGCIPWLACSMISILGEKCVDQFLV